MMVADVRTSLASTPKYPTMSTGSPESSAPGPNTREKAWTFLEGPAYTVHSSSAG